MGEEQDIAIIVEALWKVKPKKLLLIELANKIPITDGSFDYEELINRQTDIKLAVEEAKVYGAFTLSAVDHLARLRARGE